MRKIWYCLLLICLSLVIFYPAAAESCSMRPVAVEHFTIASAALGRALDFDVYVPPCMDDRIIGGYPTIYLLHGQDMGIEIWQEMEMDSIIRETINRERLPLFLTVVPQEDQYLLSLSLSEFDTAILEELIPWVDAHYNTCAGRECRSIGGLSRGALWAEKIAFEHPEVFGSLGLLSLPGTFTDDQSIYYLAEKHKPDRLLRIRMDIGSEDSYRHEANKASTQLNFIGYPYEYLIEPGMHDSEFWRSRLPDYFVWFSEGWNPVSLPGS